MINEQDWVQYLENRKLSDSSIKTYTKYFKKIEFEKFAEKGEEYLKKWINQFNNKVSRATLKNFLQFIISEQKHPKEIRELAINFEIPKITGRKKQRIPKVLTFDQILQIVRGMKEERDKLMVYCSFFLGLRCEELLSLSINDFDWDKSQVRIIGKGNKERVLPVIPQLRDRLINYINENIEKNADFEALFNISASRWRKILDKVSRKKIDRPVNPHLLRHSCGSFLHEKGLDLKEIAEFLGHADISTTQIYVHLDKKTLNMKIKNAFTS